MMGGSTALYLASLGGHSEVRAGLKNEATTYWSLMGSYKGALKNTHSEPRGLESPQGLLRAIKGY